MARREQLSVSELDVVVEAAAMQLGRALVWASWLADRCGEDDAPPEVCRELAALRVEAARRVAVWETELVARCRRRERAHEKLRP